MMNTYLSNKKAILKYQNNNHEGLGRANCCLTISVGQTYHEEDKLRATLEAISRSFMSCTIMVCDSLQRHTLKILSPLSLNILHEKSNLLGEEWIKRNLKYINTLDIPHEIIRWDYWLNHLNYQSARQFIDKLYLNNLSFYEVVNKTALAFVERNNKKYNFYEQAKALDLSQSYLKEECAVMLLWANKGYAFEIYPGERNTAMCYIYDHIISPLNGRLLKAVSIKFKNRGKINLHPNLHNTYAKLTAYKKAV